jgi:hypothetical protein
VVNGYELAAIFPALLIETLAKQGGESNWFEGLQLLAT